MSIITHRKGYTRKIEMRLFIPYNLQLEIINFLSKNLRTAASYMQAVNRKMGSAA